jgi:hypothetical protein
MPSEVSPKLSDWLADSYLFWSSIGLSNLYKVLFKLINFESIIVEIITCQNYCYGNNICVLPSTTYYTFISLSCFSSDPVNC